MRLDPRAQAISGELARRVPIQPERLCDGVSEQGVADGGEDEPERGLGDMVGLMPDRKLGNHVSDRFEDRVERVAIAGKDHPGGEGSGAFLTKRIENQVDDGARVGPPGSSAFDLFGDQAGDRIRDRSGEGALEARGRAEVMEQVGVGPPHLRGDRFESHRLWSVGEQKLARRVDRRGPALFLAQSTAFY